MHPLQQGPRDDKGQKALTNEDDIEFAIEDDEELYEAALAASHRPGGDPLAGLLRDM